MATAAPTSSQSSLRRLWLATGLALALVAFQSVTVFFMLAPTLLSFVEPNPGAFPLSFTFSPAWETVSAESIILSPITAACLLVSAALAAACVWLSAEPRR